MSNKYLEKVAVVFKGRLPAEENLKAVLKANKNVKFFEGGSYSKDSLDVASDTFKHFSSKTRKHVGELGKTKKLHKGFIHQERGDALANRLSAKGVNKLSKKDIKAGD